MMKLLFWVETRRCCAGRRIEMTGYLNLLASASGFDIRDGLGQKLVRFAQDLLSRAFDAAHLEVGDDLADEALVVMAQEVGREQRRRIGIRFGPLAVHQLCR